MSCPCHFTRRASLDGCGNLAVAARLDPWTIQPIASHYTNYTIPVHDTNNTECEIPYYFQKLFSIKCLKYLLKLSHWMCPCSCLCCVHNTETWVKTTLFHGSKSSDLNHYSKRQLQRRHYRNSWYCNSVTMQEGDLCLYNQSNKHHWNISMHAHWWEPSEVGQTVQKQSCQQHTP